MRVTVTVMPGEGIWAAQRLSQGLVEELAGQLEEEVGRNAPSAAPAASAKAAPGFRREASGAVAWVEPLDGAVQPRLSVADRTDPGDGGTGHDPVARITVAHLAS